MSLLDELANAQNQLMNINFEVSTGTWSGPDITDPVVLDGCYQADITAGISQINAACTLHFTEDPGLAPNTPIQVFAGYNGEGVACFKGEVLDDAAELAPNVWIVTCADRLGRTRFGQPAGERAYTSQDDAVIIRNILEIYDLPSTIAEIESSGWTLGGIQDVVLKENQVGWSVIEDIDKWTTYRTYTDLLGVIRRKNIFANVTSPVYTFEEGVNAVNIRRASKPRWANQQTVNGLTYEDVPVTAQITTDNPAIPAPPGVLADEQQSDLVETEVRARAAAVAILSVRRARAETTEIPTIGNPLVQPLDLIHVESPKVGVYDTIIDTINHSITASSFTTTIQAFGILNGDGATSGFDPVAVAAVVAIDMESVIIGGSPEVRYFVQLDGSESYDADGRIVTWAWSVSGGSADPATGSGPRFATTLEDLTTVTVTLTVTDEQGLTDDVTTPISETAHPVKTRALAIAGGADGLVFIADASGTPLVLARSGEECISVPAIFTGKAWAGWDSGMLTRVNAGNTLDEVNDFDSPVHALWVNEGTPENILVGLSSGIWRSLDEAATWSSIYGTGTVYDIQSSPTLPTDIRYTTGEIGWHSVDQSIPPQPPFVVGPVGSTARMIASAGWDIAYSFASAGSPGHTIRFEGSEKLVNWSGVTSPPTSITAITPNLTTPGFVAGDDTGRLFKLVQTAVGYDATLITTIGSGNTITDLMRDGTMDGIVYVAASGGTGAGVWKLLNLTTAYQLWEGDARQLGYGDLGEQTGVYEILWPTWGRATAGIWHLQAGTWAIRPFPRAGTYFIYGIAANRLGTEALVVMTTIDTPVTYHTNDWWYHDVNSSSRIVMQDSSYSPLWHVDLTKPASDPTAWTEILLPSPIPGPSDQSSGGTGKIILNVPEWSPDSDRDWIITRGADKTSGVPAVSSWWRGAGPTVGSVTTEPDRTTNDMQPATAGLNKDIIAFDYFDSAPIYNLRYIPTGSIASVAVGGNPGDAPSGKGRVELIHPDVDRAIAIAVDGADLYISTDYRADEPSSVLTGTGHRVAAAGGALYFGGRSSGVYKVTDPLGSPSGSVVAASGDAVDWIRSDRQTRSTVVAHKPGEDSLIGTLDGTTWDVITGPSVPTPDELSSVFEVIRR